MSLRVTESTPSPGAGPNKLTTIPSSRPNVATRSASGSVRAMVERFERQMTPSSPSPCSRAGGARAGFQPRSVSMPVPRTGGDAGRDEEKGAGDGPLRRGSEVDSKLEAVESVWGGGRERRHLRGRNGEEVTTGEDATQEYQDETTHALPDRRDTEADEAGATNVDGNPTRNVRGDGNDTLGGKKNPAVDFKDVNSVPDKPTATRQPGSKPSSPVVYRNNQPAKLSLKAESTATTPDPPYEPPAPPDFLGRLQTPDAPFQPGDGAAVAF
ncbi:uncharacterized protein DNG_02377 [Cephalotrichum gorgonifer]|uniref:Uncharacterized protein n=1 Tax=Cephalotrichum gorgonifer TaxID=2041049 RepID=A0AAE8MTD0_9PEZI|nr:uncharacterized protein DNG_02377 [Cephalotrichum gorgonifer]